MPRALTLEREAKRLAAAMAAVERYLEEEQHARTYAAAPAPAAATSPWGLAARLEQMNVRASMQARGRR